MRRYVSSYSIGQRLALGLGFLFAIQLALLAAVFIWLHQNEKAYGELSTGVVPRTVLGLELKQAVLYVALAARDQIHQPSRAHAVAFSQAVERARTALRFVEAVPVSTGTADPYVAVQLLVQRYVNETERIVASRAEGALDELSRVREGTLDGVRAFVAHERAATQAAFDDMDANRGRIAQLLAWLAGGSALAFVFGGWLTARSIRRPARRLLEFATALEAGNWRSALSLAPASPKAAAHMRDEMQHLANALGTAAAALESREQQLQQQNEELQAQNEEIQAQGEEIQAQGEEIQAQNSDLLEQTARLREQASALKDADQKKNEFLGLLAHELRNPLAAMANSLTLLARAGPGADTAPARAILARQLRHLVRLIDDLLDITRISRGKIHLRRRPLELAALLGDCIADLQASAREKGVRLELSAPGEPLWVSGDDTRLSQVFGNIVGNAIKFTDAGGCVALSARAEAGFAIVRIADTGQGMDEALLERLFTPFSQGDGELSQSGGGLGLGLALVKGLVELHGGRVQAASEGPGRGTELTVRLPLCAAPAQEAQRGTPAQPQALRSARILLVEDNVDVGDSMRVLLELDGHEVRIVRSGTDALQAAKDFHPEVVLCDIGLPGMDGYEVARALRRQSANGKPLLIALTGYAAGADQERTAQAGFDHHLPKPPDLERLYRLLAGR